MKIKNQSKGHMKMGSGKGQEKKRQGVNKNGQGWSVPVGLGKELQWGQGSYSPWQWGSKGVTKNDEKSNEKRKTQFHEGIGSRFEQMTKIK